MQLLLLPYSVAEDHAYHALHYEKSSNMEKNEEKPCSTIISESEQEITSPSPISSIPDKINLEDLFSEVLNDSEDPSVFKFLKKIRGGFLENHKMAYFGKSLLAKSSLSILYQKV